MLLFVTALATKHLIALCQAANFLYPSGEGCFSVTLLINPLSPSPVQSGNRASPALKAKGLAHLGSIKPVGFMVVIWGFFCGDGRWKISKIQKIMEYSFGN